MTKVAVKPTVRLNAYGIISDRLEGVCAAGIRRYYKHRDGGPDDEEINAMGEIAEQYVMNALCEILEFDDET